MDRVFEKIHPRVLVGGSRQLICTGDSTPLAGTWSLCEEILYSWFLPLFVEEVWCSLGGTCGWRVDSEEGVSVLLG